MALLNDTVLDIIDALASIPAGKEFALAVNNGSVLSKNTMARLIDTIGDKQVALNLQAAILCQKTLSAHDIAVIIDAFSSKPYALDIVNNIGSRCFISNPAGPAVVNLGSAANYRILAESGISNASNAIVTGDIAVSPIDHTAITGFSLVLDGGGAFATSADVVGDVFAADYASPTPANLTAAVSAMNAAYTDAQGRVTPAPTVGLGAGTLNGQTLTAGIYKWSTPVDITGPITINGGPSHKVILQIAGTLDLEAGIVINLTGGILPQNIFWAVAGAVTLKTSSVFRGIMLGATSVAVQATATVHGRLYAQTAVTLISGTVGA
jgi:hypothetical protein